MATAKSKAKKKSVAKKIPSPKIHKRRYEGASKQKRLSRWQAPSTSANAAIGSSLITLRNRSRDLRRNNPYAAKAIQVVTSNVVGQGIATQFRGPNATKLEALWKSWAETMAIDFDGRNNIYGLERLVCDAVIESGEVLVRKRINSALKFPLQYQVLEADLLDGGRNEVLKNGNSVVQGIEYDADGRRLAYYLFETHPNSFDPTATTTLKSNRIPATELRHIFRQDRPGQGRGVPWLAPAIVRLKDLDDYEDAQLIRQKVAALFVGFVRDIAADFVEGAEVDNSLDGEKMEPGIIEHLPAGKTIEFAKPPEVTGYNDYVAVHLRAVANAIGITYESISGDLSQVNFSSARMGWLEMGRNVQTWREDIMIAHCLDPIADDFLAIALLMGVETSGSTYVHVPPKREMFDPTKEIPAVIKALRAGLTTLSDEIMANGKDPAEFLKKYAEDMALLDKLGLKLISDPRNEMKGGTNEPRETGDGEGE